MDTAWPYNSRCDFPYRRQCSFGSDRLGSESETTWSGSGPASVHLRTRPILCHDRPRSPVGPTCAVGGGPLFRHVNRVSTGRQAETEGSTTTTPVEGVCLPHAGPRVGPSVRHRPYVWAKDELREDTRNVFSFDSRIFVETLPTRSGEGETCVFGVVVVVSSLSLPLSLLRWSG